MENDAILTNGQVPYWNVLKNLSNSVKLELISLLSDSMVHKPKQECDAHWADQFAGAWLDNRGAEEIIEDIRISRTANRDIEL